MSWAPQPTAELLQSLPETYDFAKQFPDAAANEMMNQGDCTSCWAFAAAKAYSGALYKISKGKFNIQLSEQRLVSCKTDAEFDPEPNWTKVEKVEVEVETENTSSCDSGADVQNAWGPMQSKGVVTRQCDEYQEAAAKTHKCMFTEKQCQKEGRGDLEYMVDSMYNIPVDETSIKAAVVKYGPLYMSMNCFDESFGVYGEKGGIYEVEAKDDGGGHAMCLTGWGKKNGKAYWIIANSHGKNWGEGGYIYWSIDAMKTG
jgi:C1A family cysteine protease